MKHDRYNQRDTTEPNHYIWGFLYFDPGDHRIIIPRKIAWMGWTLNFASPFSYLLIAGAIALAYWINEWLR
jgi:uncharacterized membrane protein